jgi:hypothetical protein
VEVSGKIHRRVLWIFFFAKRLLWIVRWGKVFSRRARFAGRRQAWWGPAGQRWGLENLLVGHHAFICSCLSVARGSQRRTGHHPPIYSMSGLILAPATPRRAVSPGHMPSPSLLLPAQSSLVLDLSNMILQHKDIFSQVITSQKLPHYLCLIIGLIHI